MIQAPDLLVIGSGVAGRATASICRKAGWNVTIVEQREIGGTCPLRGCDPKKVLVGAAELLDAARRMKGKGIVARELAIDWPSLMNFKRSFTRPKPENLTQQLQKQGVVIRYGTAGFLSAGEVAVGNEVFTPRYILVATGATPASLPIEGGENLITSDEFLDLPELPQRIVFVGGGFISMEFAHLAIRCRRNVTVLEYLDRPLQAFDPDLVDLMVQKSRQIGIDLRTGIQVKRITKNSQGLRVEAQNPEGTVVFPADIAVHGAGRVPATHELNLSAAGIATEGGGIKVNQYLQTISHNHIYAAGDVAATPSPQLTRVAAYQGKLVAKNLLDNNVHKVDHSGIPSVVFTIPPIAMVGLSEQAARDTSIPIEVRHEDMGGWFATKKTGEDTAAYKLIIDTSTNQVVGAHILTHQAGEIINLLAMAIRLRMPIHELKKAVLAYPTEGSLLTYML